MEGVAEEVVAEERVEVVKVERGVLEGVLPIGRAGIWGIWVIWVIWGVVREGWLALDNLDNRCIGDEEVVRVCVSEETEETEETSVRISRRSCTKDGRARVTVYFRPLTLIPMVNCRASC